MTLLVLVLGRWSQAATDDHFDDLNLKLLGVYSAYWSLLLPKDCPRVTWTACIAFASVLDTARKIPNAASLAPCP
jgi:hypothetical protein